MQFKTQKMKVKLAVQVISSFCALVMEFLRNIGVHEFSDSLPTEILFCRLDRLFDSLNCRSVFGKGFKSPTNVGNDAGRMHFYVRRRTVY